MAAGGNLSTCLPLNNAECSVPSRRPSGGRGGGGGGWYNTISCEDLLVLLPSAGM